MLLKRSFKSLIFTRPCAPYHVVKGGFAPNIDILLKSLRNLLTDPDQTNHNTSGSRPHNLQCSVHVPTIYSAVFTSPQFTVLCSRPHNLQCSVHVPTIYSAVFTSPQFTVQCPRPHHLQCSVHVPTIYSAVSVKMTLTNPGQELRGVN